MTTMGTSKQTPWSNAKEALGHSIGRRDVPVERGRQRQWSSDVVMETMKMLWQVDGYTRNWLLTSLARQEFGVSQVYGWLHRAGVFREVTLTSTSILVMRPNAQCNKQCSSFGRSRIWFHIQ